LNCSEDEILVAELYRLEVGHLSRLAPIQPTGSMPPAELLAALAVHAQARFQASLIVVFLRHPEFSAALPLALEHLSPLAADTLKLYYQAAVYPQRELGPDLQSRSQNWTPLPDLFSLELGLPPPRALSRDQGVVRTLCVHLAKCTGSDQDGRSIGQSHTVTTCPSF
jgi:hypothetical protein